MTDQIAFTVLNDSFDQISDQSGNTEPAWQKMYQSNVISAPPNSPFLDYEMPHIGQDYETLTFASKTPKIPAIYDIGRAKSAALIERNKQYNLPYNTPVPLQGPVNLPSFSPPYGTPYPSSRYSSWDGELAVQTGVPTFYSLPGVPAGTPPALIDARNSPGVPMGPYQLDIIAENKFREGFQQAKEHFSTPTCIQSIEHFQNCAICNKFISNRDTFYKFSILFLVILIFALLWMLNKRVKRNK